MNFERCILSAQEGVLRRDSRRPRTDRHLTRVRSLKDQRLMRVLVDKSIHIH